MWSHWEREQGGSITPQAHLWGPDRTMLTLNWVCISNQTRQSCGPAQSHSLFSSLLQGGPKSRQDRAKSLSQRQALSLPGRELCSFPPPSMRCLQELYFLRDQKFDSQREGHKCLSNIFIPRQHWWHKKDWLRRGDPGGSLPLPTRAPRTAHSIHRHSSQVPLDSH